MHEIQSDRGGNKVVRGSLNNAEIALSKFKLFTWAAYFTFSGAVVGLLLILMKIAL